MNALNWYGTNSLIMRIQLQDVKWISPKTGFVVTQFTLKTESTMVIYNTYV